MPFDGSYHAAFYCEICFKHLDCFGQTFSDAKHEAEKVGWKIRRAAHIALCPDHLHATKSEIEAANKKRDED